jgi:hypothetical protein
MFIVTILSNTPIWVWVLLAFLISRGVAAMSPREVSANLMLIIPVVFLVWGLTGMFGGDGLAYKLALFAGGVLAGLACGGALASLLPAPRLSRTTGLLAMPGSPVPLILIGLAFATKYIGTVALALNPDLVVHAEISAAMAAVGGLFAGLFWGRTLGQFARALQADGEPVTLRGLVDLVTARSSPSAPGTAP